MLSHFGRIVESLYLELTYLTVATVVLKLRRGGQEVKGHWGIGESGTERYT